MRYPALLRVFVLLSLSLATCATLSAEVRCARLFTDHLVLQCDRPVPVWGTGTPGERVSVEFAGALRETTVGADGNWRVDLPAHAPSAEGRTLTVRASNTLVFREVVVGEVWFCSGQSNMEKPLGERKGQKPTAGYDIEFAAAERPLLRLFQVPRTDLKQDGPGVLRWLPCTPENLRASNFSAAAYHFGRVVQPALGVPVGLIHASFGGTRLEAWLPPEAFADPQLAGLEKEKYPAWVPGVQPTELFQSMVRPYAPFGLRGFLWYQGESNLMSADVAAYAHKQAVLIAQWRRVFEAPEAPFYGVLLAPMDYSKWEKFPTTAEALPRFWQAQIEALSAPRTGYAVITDLVENFHDIHPVEKRGVGERLARLALVETYGRADLASRGPTFQRLTAKGNAIELTFAHATGLHTRDGRAPDFFQIAGADQVFHPAEAKIESGLVRVSSPAVAQPVAVRFAWSEVAAPNLINAAGLPAVPFRTDDWPVQVDRPVVEAPKPPRN